MRKHKHNWVIVGIHHMGFFREGKRIDLALQCVSRNCHQCAVRSFRI